MLNISSELILPADDLQKILSIFFVSKMKMSSGANLRWCFKGRF